MEILDKAFTGGQDLTVLVGYENLEGGFRSAKVSLDYKGSRRSHSRKSSFWATAFQGKGTTSPNGEIKVRIFPQPTDDPPFDLTYFLRVCGTNGCSNWASASAKYVDFETSERLRVKWWLK